MIDLFRQTFQEWAEDKVSLLAAGLAYYTLFSLAPLLLIVIGAFGFFVGEAALQSSLLQEIRAQAGPQVADAVRSILENASAREGGLIPTLVGIVTLVIGATTVLAQLQNALNVIWEVKPDPAGSAIGRLLFVRVLSLGMLLVIGFLLLVSLLLSAALSTVWDNLPGVAALWPVVDFALSLAMITVLFALIFKYIPDARIAWRDVWVGAAFSAALFSIGKFGLSLYVSQAGIASSYGAAGSVVVLLLWVYYSAQVLLLGGEFTQVYARRRGQRLEPAEHAVRTGDAYER